MWKKQFPSFDDAVEYCESRGMLEFFGRVGFRYEYCTYCLYIGGVVYMLDIRDDGFLRVRGKRRRLPDE